MMHETKLPESRLGESVVSEVRRIRDALDVEAGHDLARLAEMARQASARIRKEYGMKVASLDFGKPNLPGKE